MNKWLLTSDKELTAGQNKHIAQVQCSITSMSFLGVTYRNMVEGFLHQQKGHKGSCITKSMTSREVCAPGQQRTVCRLASDRIGSKLFNCSKPFLVSSSCLKVSLRSLYGLSMSGEEEHGQFQGVPNPLSCSLV